MKKEKNSLTKRIIFLFLFISFLNYQNTFSQCLTPPTEPLYFCEVDNATVDNLTIVGGINVVWFDALEDGNQYAPETVLTSGLYYALETDASCSDPIRTEVEVIIIPEVDVPTDVYVFLGKCASEDAKIEDLSATGFNILWYDAQFDGNLLPYDTSLVNGVTYWVAQTDPLEKCESNRLPTTVTIIDPPTPTVVLNQIFCETENPTVASLQATEPNVYWYSSNVSSTPLDPNTPLIDGEDYWATQVTFPCESTIRTQVNVQIDNEVYAGINGTYTECEIDAITTNLYDLLGNSPLPDITGVWTGPSTLSGDYLGTFVPGANIDGVYTYTVSSDLSVCPNQVATVTVVINKPLPPTITESTQSFCEAENATVASLMPNDANIIWYDAAGTALTSDIALLDGNVYSAAQTEIAGSLTCESVNRNDVTVVINKPLPPTITESTQSFCEAENATVASLMPNDANIIWYDAAGTVLTSDIALLDGNVYSAAQTEIAGSLTCESVNRNDVTVVINKPLPPTITESTQSFCEAENATVASLMPNDANIIWYDAAGTVLTSDIALLDGNVYSAAQTEIAGSLTCESVNRNDVTVVINKPLPPTITESTQSFCEAENATVASLMPNDANIIWYDAAGTVLTSDIALLDGNVYSAAQTEIAGSLTCESVNRNDVTVVINKPLPPTITESTQSFCEAENATVASLMPNDANIIWYDAAGTVLTSDIALLDGNVYSAAQTEIAGSLTCESVNRKDVTVVISKPTTPTTNNNTQTFCKADNSTIGDLQINDSDYTIVWYADISSSVALDSNQLLVDGTTYYAAEVDVALGCESNLRLMITVSITDVSPATITTVSQTYCASDFPTIEDLDVTGNSVVWYDTETSTIPLTFSDFLLDDEDYWAAQSNSTTSCESSKRVVVNVTLTNPDTPIIIVNGNEFCKIDKPTLADLDANVTSTSNGIITWYDSFPNGTSISLSELLVEGETYYAIDNIDGCSSINPLEVIVSLESCEAYDVDIYDGFSPTGNGINETFKLGNLKDLYPNYSVEFYNRWGNLVYTANASKADWNGRLKGDGELVPAGVYYFIIYFNKNGRKPMQRRLYLSR